MYSMDLEELFLQARNVDDSTSLKEDARAFTWPPSEATQLSDTWASNSHLLRAQSAQRKDLMGIVLTEA